MELRTMKICAPMEHSNVSERNIQKDEKRVKKKKKEEKGETNVFKRNPLGCGQHENFICFRIPADQSILNEQNHSG